MVFKELSPGIFVIDYFWTKGQCESFISQTEAAGYMPATIETEKGHKMVEAVRNNNRYMYADTALANDLWTQIRPLAPAQIGISYARGLNEMFRFYRYTPGQRFKKHTDQSFIRNYAEASLR